MHRWKLTFEYDGSGFSGWQRQPNVRTVQGVAEAAFSTLYRTDIEITGQGRTDAGVHATGQVAHADLPDSFDEARILRAMRGLLPADVALLGAKVVAPDFHARFSAMSRCYRYQISLKPAPLQRHMVWNYTGNSIPDVDLLNRCAEKILGKHDFINFCIPSGDEHATTICSIQKSVWKKEGELWTYRIEGNRFLRHMVRRLVGEMIRVSAGKKRIEQFEELLMDEPAKEKGYTAPPEGLILEEVRYSG